MRWDHKSKKGEWHWWFALFPTYICKSKADYYESGKWVWLEWYGWTEEPGFWWRVRLQGDDGVYYKNMPSGD